MEGHSAARDLAPNADAATAKEPLPQGWKTGDLVRLKAEEADGWRQPFKGFALKGRLATLHVGSGPAQHPFVLQFHVRPGAQRQSLSASNDRYFERAPPQ